MKPFPVEASFLAMTFNQLLLGMKGKFHNLTNLSLDSFRGINYHETDGLECSFYLYEDNTFYCTGLSAENIWNGIMFVSQLLQAHSPSLIIHLCSDPRYYCICIMNET